MPSSYLGKESGEKAFIAFSPPMADDSVLEGERKAGFRLSHVWVSTLRARLTWMPVRVQNFVPDDHFSLSANYQPCGNYF